jgi:predicted ferric reductase
VQNNSPISSATALFKSQACGNIICRITVALMTSNVIYRIFKIIHRTIVIISICIDHHVIMKTECLALILARHSFGLQDQKT